VLAVDDDPLVLMNTAAMLEDLGHTVMQATSGDVALNILKQAVKIDLVITDQAMPKMTGTQLAEAIKEDWPKVPIMLATGYADIEDKPGMALPRLSKPFTQRQLSEAMAQVIQAKSFAGRVLKFFRPPS
jgi:CheY-like chemotaxis protein